jgi:hypothetical protein
MSDGTIIANLAGCRIKRAADIAKAGFESGWA